MVYTRCLTERTGHTRNDRVNLAAISIVLAGNFQERAPEGEQIAALERVIKELDDKYHFERIIGHRDTPSSPTACPGEKLAEWIEKTYGEKRKMFVLSRYYTPVRDQEYYYRDSYEADFKINCHGDCLSTASAYRLSEKDVYKVVACPKIYPFGTKFIVNGDTFTCWDRGGAIIEDQNMIRLDIWAGIGTDAIDRIKNTSVPYDPEVVIMFP